MSGYSEQDKCIRRPQERSYPIAMHQVVDHRAEDPWSVASLAAEIHLSRSVFSERFSRLVGMAPMQYVTRWRMHLASSWIREDRLSLSEVAYRLSYSSEAAFSRAFKRHQRVSPGVIRRGA